MSLLFCILVPWFSIQSSSTKKKTKFEYQIKNIQKYPEHNQHFKMWEGKNKNIYSKTATCLIL